LNLNFHGIFNELYVLLDITYSRLLKRGFTILYSPRIELGGATILFGGKGWREGATVGFIFSAAFLYTVLRNGAANQS
jgi:hypothetical protein